LGSIPARWDELDVLILSILDVTRLEIEPKFSRTDLSTEYLINYFLISGQTFNERASSRVGQSSQRLRPKVSIPEYYYQLHIHLKKKLKHYIKYGYNDKEVYYTL